MARMAALRRILVFLIIAALVLPRCAGLKNVDDKQVDSRLTSGGRDANVGHRVPPCK